MAVELELFGRLALAAALGYLIGFEREWRGKAAGERTFALVALGAAAFTGVAVEQFGASADRVIQGVVAGIGFLGAGLIFRQEGEIVRGLTTAASAWAVAALGVVCGTGLYLLAFLTTLLILLILELSYLPVIRRIDAKRLREQQDEGSSEG